MESNFFCPENLFTIFLVLQIPMQFGQIWIFYPRLDSNMKENINKRSHHLIHRRQHLQHSKSLGKCHAGPSFYNKVETFACFCWINIDLWTKIANIRPGEITGKTFPPEYNIPKILVRQTHLKFQYLSKDFHHWATWREKPPWGPSCPP